MSEKVTRNRSRAPLMLFAAGLVVLVLAGSYVWFSTPAAVADEQTVVVYKTPACGCCGDWVEHLRTAGLQVSVVDVDSTQAHRREAGVPNSLGSCHTAVVGDYFVEGHVPADLVQSLIDSRPSNIRGIAVPGMPIGSPGMEGPNPVEYDVLAYDTDGKVFVFATRQGSSQAEAR